MSELTRSWTGEDVEAPGVPLDVVAVKWPNHWIIRGMRCFASLDVVDQMVWPFVAAAPQDELEWTHHRYKFPGYLVYGSGDLPGLGGTTGRDHNWPVPPNGCVYLFPHSGGDVYRGPVRRLA